MFFKLRVSLFSWFFGFAISEKALNSQNGTFSRGLTCHGVKLACPFKLFCHNGALFVEVNQLNSLIFCPIFKSFVSDKLSRPNHLVNDSVLVCFAFQLERSEERRVGKECRSRW